MSSSSIPRPWIAARSLSHQAVAQGLAIAKVHPQHLGWPLDPFLQVDWFRMSQPFFPPHPHAGFSAVTYMLPGSPGGFVNRDSLGHRNLISPGALHWTEAAHGVMHEEVPIERGVECHGLQIFVNLPAARKHDAPAAYHAEPADVPTVERDGGRVRCYVGHFDGQRAALAPKTTCALWDVAVDAGASLSLPLPRDWNATLLLVAGDLMEGGQRANGPAAIGLAAGDAIVLHAGATPVHAVLLAGPPLDEPVVAGGPFVMTSAEDIADAKRRFARGEMGRLEASF